jgi:hypothetical protein
MTAFTNASRKLPTWHDHAGQKPAQSRTRPRAPHYRRGLPSVSSALAAENPRFHEKRKEPMSKATRDCCDICGSATFAEGRFSMGKLWCVECFSGQRPPVSMPPTEAGKRQIVAWLRPRTSTPAAQQTLAGVELGRPQGASRG